MSEQQAIDFAESSAFAAIDYLGEMPDSIQSYRDNIRDTLNGHYASEYEAVAFEVYDKKVAELLAAHRAK